MLKDSITNEATMIYYDPTRPTVMRVEASYNDGLSAGLFKEAERGLHPVHYISRSLTDTEKRCSQTETFSVKWTNASKSIGLELRDSKSPLPINHS